MGGRPLSRRDPHARARGRRRLCGHWRPHRLHLAAGGSAPERQGGAADGRGRGGARSQLGARVGLDLRQQLEPLHVPPARAGGQPRGGGGVLMRSR
eukprot:501449-Prymnesium_polylepis.1